MREMMEPQLAKQRRQEILREVERNRLVKGFRKIASSTEGRGTMQEPAFNETLQLGIVVRDLEATVRRYEDDYGIGPWEFHQMDLGEANDYREYGEPVERSTRIAIAMVGQVMWELIEPLDEDGIYARFLAAKGEGVHHVAVTTPNFDETVAQAERESKVILSCEFSGIDIAYLDTLRDLGVIIEIASGMPGDEELPDANRTS
jgi:methylmalonyl-CoA/ethylmalonyl-CoA epimerase